MTATNDGKPIIFAERRFVATGETVHFEDSKVRFRINPDAPDGLVLTIEDGFYVFTANIAAQDSDAMAAGSGTLTGRPVRWLGYAERLGGSPEKSFYEMRIEIYGA